MLSIGVLHTFVAGSLAARLVNSLGRPLGPLRHRRRGTSKPASVIPAPRRADRSTISASGSTRSGHGCQIFVLDIPQSPEGAGDEVSMWGGGVWGRERGGGWLGGGVGWGLVAPSRPVPCRPFHCEQLGLNARERRRLVSAAIVAGPHVDHGSSTGAGSMTETAPAQSWAKCQKQCESGWRHRP